MSECKARHDRLANLRYSQAVECCVCMEHVLEKPTTAERKFGLLSCEHAFCLGCIRGWRSHHEGGADTDTVSTMPSSSMLKFCLSTPVNTACSNVACSIITCLLRNDGGHLS